MKKFTKEEIENGKRYFKSQEFPEVDVVLGDRSFSYFLIPQSQEPNLTNFVLRMTGDPDDGYVLGISDNVDERFRQYAVAHEYIEFTEIGIDTPERCTRALEEELNLVPSEIKQDYIKMRQDFFKDLISYCTKQPQFYTQNDLDQFQHNVDTLDKLII